mgnify:CR=1 FL=1
MNKVKYYLNPCLARKIRKFSRMLKEGYKNYKKEVEYLRNIKRGYILDREYNKIRKIIIDMVRLENKIKIDIMGMDILDSLSLIAKKALVRE